MLEQYLFKRRVLSSMRFSAHPRAALSLDDQKPLPSMVTDNRFKLFKHC